MMKNIVKWQYEKLEGTLGLLEEHLADPDCPCHSDGENCARKHLKRAEDYAQETMILLARDPQSPAGEMNKLDLLSTEARSYRQAEERHLCGKKVPEKEFATISWASNWRKYFENLLVGACSVTAHDSKPVIVVGEDTTWIRDVIAVVRDKRWHGPAYRAYTGYSHGRDQTAGDVIRYEQDELGNDYGIGTDKLKYFDKFPAWAIRWLTKTRKDAERYGDEIEREDAEGNLIVAEDGDEGYLVLDTTSELKLSKEARDAWEGEMRDTHLEAKKCRFDEATFAEQYGLIGTWLEELRERWENNNPWGFVRMLNEFCSMKYVGPRDPGLKDLTPAEKDRQYLLKTALEHVSKATIDMARASEFHFNVDEKIADGLRSAWGATEHAYHQISNMIGVIVAKELNFAQARDDLEDPNEKSGTIQRIIEMEIYLGKTSSGKAAIETRARELSKMKMPDLEPILRKLYEPRLDLQNEIQKLTYKALGRKVPAWLKQTDIEELADDYVLPIMKDWPGDKLTLGEIREYTEKFGASPFTDEELRAALDYLQDGGEIMSFEKTAEKPERWTILFYEDSGKLGAKETPKLIEVFTTTIVKHYRPKAAFHKKSFRVLKPTKDILIYLGCLKTHDWRGQVCSDNQTLHKTIVKKTDKGMKEVKKLESQGIGVKYFNRKGIVPRAEDDILEEIAEALNQAETV